MIKLPKNSQDLLSVLIQNHTLFDAIQIISNDHSKKFFIGAGAITQTVWNAIFGYDPAYGIDDIDIIYFDNTDLSESAENTIIESLSQQLKHISITPDIKNQARVHLWYKTTFGYEIPPLLSVEDAVDQWPTTANSIAVRLDELNNLELYAPFGLEDLFSGVIRPNKRQVKEEVYYNKARKWKKKWPDLKIIPWD